MDANLENHISQSENVEASYSDYENGPSHAMPDARGADSAIPTPAILSPKYRIVREIGHGAQGHVYEAIRQSDGLHVAIKELRIRSLTVWKDYELFRREGKILASMDIPGVAKVYDALEQLDGDAPAAYLVQEYIDGCTLADMLEAGYHFTFAEVFAIASQILRILADLHGRDPVVIHRDIKPSNIMLHRHGAPGRDVYLIDFGAVANPQLQSGGSTVAGTYGYMPPEQLVGNPTTASDYYALAATVVHLLGGVPPSQMQVLDFRPVIEPHLYNVPRPVILVLQKMIEPSPERRLCDNALLRRTFEEFSKGNYGFVRSADWAPILGGSEEQCHDVKKWNEALRNVKIYGQQGNFELWQRLEENTPRKDIPEMYRPFPHQSRKDRFHKRLNRIDWDKADSISGGLCKIFVVLPLVVEVAMIAIMVVILVKTIVLYDGSVTSLDLWSWLKMELVPAMKAHNFVGMCFFMVLVNIALGVVLPILWALLVLLFGRTYYFMSDAIKRANSAYRDLIQNGTKCIATIEKVEYMSPEERFIFFANTLAFPPQVQPFMHNPLLCALYARFRIRYRFGIPMQDGTSKSVTHEIQTLHDVTRNLHPGDAFPILYIAERACNGTPIRATSMPFPIPFPDIESLNYQNAYATGPVKNPD